MHNKMSFSYEKGMRGASELVWALLKWPLKTLYRKGPRLLHLWEGLGEENICYELTNVDALFWVSSEDSVLACEELIGRKFEAFVVSVYAILFVYIAYTLFCMKLYEYVFLSGLSRISRLPRLDAPLDERNKT